MKIAIENCPMIFSYDEWPGGDNLMHAPATWRDVFGHPRRRHARAQPRPVTPRLADDRLRAGRARVRPRIYHVHAKDMEIDRDGLYDRGVLSAGMGWQVPRLPGLGEVRWDRYIDALYRAGYDYAIVRRARGPPVRGHRREGQGRLPAGQEHSSALHRLTRRSRPQRCGTIATSSLVRRGGETDEGACPCPYIHRRRRCSTSWSSSGCPNSRTCPSRMPATSSWRCRPSGQGPTSPRSGS